MQVFLAEGGSETPVIWGREKRAEFIGEVLSILRYERLPREAKGVVRQYLQVASGYSRAQVARAIAEHRQKSFKETVQKGVKMVLPKSIIPFGLAACFLLLMTSASFRSPERALTFLNGDLINVWDMSKKFADTLPMDRSLLASLSTVETVMPDGTHVDLLVVKKELVLQGYHRLAERTVVEEVPETLEDQVVNRRETRLQSLWSSLIGSSVEQRRLKRLLAQEKNNQTHAAASENVIKQEITVSGGPTNIWDLLGSGREGEVLLIKDGRPVWGSPASSTIGNPELGGGRVPPDVSRGGGGDGGRGYGGGGGSTTTNTTTNTTTTVTNTVGDSDWTVSGTDMYSAVAGNVGIGIATPETKLEIVGTASGTMFHASDLLTTSGGLIVEEGQTVTFNSVAYLFPASDGSASGKVLKTDSNGNLSWATDSNDAGVGISQVSGDARYVNISGDTMTGSLDVSATASGWIIHAQDLLTSSGALSVDGLTYLNSNTAITGVLAVTSNISGSGTLSIQGASSLQGALTL
ncbi:hypothetical protein KKF55_01870, partial [Patescibacteria group bacterium]|nr:hypothetical protein [Patescibacteria group bacterium]